jgi:hypothetical protein
MPPTDAQGQQAPAGGTHPTGHSGALIHDALPADPLRPTVTATTDLPHTTVVSQHHYHVFEACHLGGHYSGLINCDNCTWT